MTDVHAHAQPELFRHRDAGPARRFIVAPGGELHIYDSVSRCTRCALCAPACPTYQLHASENASGRGRNQAVKMAIEGRINLRYGDAGLESVVSSCALCGACTSVCPSSIKTVEHVLEARRALGLSARRGLGGVLLSRLALSSGPESEKFISYLILLSKAGIPQALAACGLASLLRVKWLGRAGRLLAEARLKTLRSLLAARPPAPEAAGKPKALYFLSCGENYLTPEAGLDTVRLLERFLGRVPVLDCGCCGAPSYYFGRVEDARDAALRLLDRYDAVSGGEDLPLYSGCSFCVSHLRNLEQFFIDDDANRARAKRLAARVDHASRGVVSALSAVGEPRQLAFSPGRLSFHGAPPFARGEENPSLTLLKFICGEGRISSLEGDVGLGACHGHYISNPELNRELVLRKVRAIACGRGELAVCDDPFTCVQIAAGLKKYYPHCRAEHISSVVLRVLGAGDAGKN